MTRVLPCPTSHSRCWLWNQKVKGAQLCLTLCDPMDGIHGILQARILEWVAFSFSRASSQLRDRTQVSHTAGGFLPAKPQENPKKTSGWLIQRIFPTQELSRGLLHCGQILYQLSYEGSPWNTAFLIRYLLSESWKQETQASFSKSQTWTKRGQTDSPSWESAFWSAIAARPKTVGTGVSRRCHLGNASFLSFLRSHCSAFPLIL